jgi:transposase InsO family protein
VKLDSQGWEKRRMSRWRHVSRPTVNAWIARVEAEHFAGLMDRKRGPKQPPRKVWLPRMGQVYHLQKVPPDAGAFRIWRLLAQPDISVRTVGRIMALKRLVYDDLPHGPTRGIQPPPGPHPSTASPRHQDWCIDGRRMDVAVEGGHWWSILILEGSSRPILAGALAPTEATWAALMVWSTAGLRDGVPQTLVSDSGGASTSHAFEGACTRLQLAHEPIESTRGASSQKLMETHVNIQRRLSDYQCSLARSPLALAQCHQAFIQTDHTTAHQGLLKDRRCPPSPAQVLGETKGRMDTPEELARAFAQAVFPRTTNRYGWVTLPSDHFYVEEGLPHPRGWLWVYGAQLRAVFDDVVRADYRCHYGRHEHRVADIRAGIFYPTRVTSPQLPLIPLTPRESLVVYHPRSPRHRASHPAPIRQMGLLAVVPMGS